MGLRPIGYTVLNRGRSSEYCCCHPHHSRTLRNMQPVLPPGTRLQKQLLKTSNTNASFQLLLSKLWSLAVASWAIRTGAVGTLQAQPQRHIHYLKAWCLQHGQRPQPGRQSSTGRSMGASGVCSGLHRVGGGSITLCITHIHIYLCIQAATFFQPVG